MPPGVFAPAAATPSSRLKTMKGPAGMTFGAGGTAPAGGLTPGIGGFGAAPAAPASTIPQNRTLETTYGGNQQTDQMGRVITQFGSTTPMAGIDPKTGMWSSNLQPGGGVTIEDPDQIRRSRDLADEQTRLAMQRDEYDYRQSKQPTPTGVDTSDLDGLLSKFKPDSVPREAPQATPARVTGESPEDRRAAESAAFARAAERISAVGRGNLAGLRNMMTRRGISGSGIEGRLAADTRNNTAGQLGEVIRDQAIEGLDREQAINDRNYAGDISQRNADIGIGSNNLSAGVSQRGQDLAQSDWKLQALPSILALMRLRSGTAA